MVLVFQAHTWQVGYIHSPSIHILAWDSASLSCSGRLLTFFIIHVGLNSRLSSLNLPNSWDYMSAPPSLKEERYTKIENVEEIVWSFNVLIVNVDRRVSGWQKAGVGAFCVFQIIYFHS